MHQVLPRVDGSAVAADALGDLAPLDAHIGEQVIVERLEALDVAIEPDALDKTLAEFVKHFSVSFLGRKRGRYGPRSSRPFQLQNWSIPGWRFRQGGAELFAAGVLILADRGSGLLQAGPQRVFQE
jgi:hypothetical protein